MSLLRSDGVEVGDDLSEAFWVDAGAIKVSPGGLPIADCFGIALVRWEACDLLTTDHKAMDKLVDTGLVSLKFIR